MSFLGSPKERREFVFGQPMKPCKKCGSNLRHQVPIKLNEDLPEPFDAKKMLGIWARARKDGKTPLEGTAYLMCGDCLHKGPSVDVSGRTAEDVGKDPVVAKEMKRLWNEEE